MGAAVSVVDFDQDGWDDFYVTNSGEDSHNALYRNMHDGTFRDVAVNWASPTSMPAKQACPWERSGATMTTMVTKMC